MDVLLILAHIVIAVLLIGLILIQHGKGADAGASAFGGGGGASASFFGSQGSASFLTRASALLATAFFVSSLTLAYYAGNKERAKSVTQTAPATVTITEEAPTDLPEFP